jgi:phage terminase large subunit-like protein
MPNSDSSLRQLVEFLTLFEAEQRRRDRNKLDTFFPDDGPFRRELYPKHLEFFAAGEDHNERAFIAGNRCGKTVAGCFEDTVHLTGLYPDWWTGRRFACPTAGWVAGDTSKTVRDILQLELLGDPNDRGTGMIPGDLIVDLSNARGVADSIDMVWVRHASGGVSTLGFKSYSEGRQNFQGTAKHFIHFDEEPEMSVYREALMRTMITPGDSRGGLCYLTFTPLKGWSDVIEGFLGHETK